MIKFNDTFIIGIDHGYGNLKTANTFTPSGVKIHESEPPFKKDVLEYDGKYICIGENHKFFVDDKTADMDNYYLTLYGIAQELSLAGITESHVHLAVGLPLMWYSEQRESFAEYLRQNEYDEFGYNGKQYRIHIDSCRTEKLGVEKCVFRIRNAVMNKFHEGIDDSIITKFFRNEEQELPEEYRKVMENCTADYCSDILAALYSNEYNSKLMKLYVVGGGAVVMSNHNTNPPNTTFITDICANAKGYEFQAKRNLRKCADGKDNKSQA